jgi:hypothetical protein
MTLALLVTTLAALADDPRSGDCLAPGDDTPVPNIALPTYDEPYDLYTRAIVELDAGLTPAPYAFFRVDQGMAGLYDSGMHPYGAIKTVKDESQNAHFIEHWLVDIDYDEWLGEEEFTIEKDPRASFPRDVADKVYLYMDLKYYETPAAAFFSPLTLQYSVSPLLDAWAYDIIQDDDIVGHLLREKHANDNWVDYWLFGFDYDIVDVNGESMSVELRDVQPATASEFFSSLPPLQANFEFFSKVVFKKRHGCALYEFLD